MKTNNTKGSSILITVIAILLIAGFAYYKFVYSTKPGKVNVATSVTPSIVLQESDSIVDQKFKFGFAYVGEENYKIVKEFEGVIDRDFQLNGLMMEFVYLDTFLPADRVRMTGMDFQYKTFLSAINNKPEDDSHEVLFTSKECQSRPRLYVSKNTKFEKVSDLSGKKIVISDTLTFPDIMYDFLVRAKLDESDVYKVLRPGYVFKVLPLGVFDAVVINKYNYKGEISNTGFITEEVLAQAFREIPVDYPEVPCRGLFASKKLDKKVVDKFIKTQVMEHKGDSITEKYFKSFGRFTSEDMEKIKSGMNWEKIEKLKLKAKQIEKDFQPAATPSPVPSSPAPSEAAPAR